MASDRGVRIVHIDPGGFEDVTIEQSTLSAELGSITFETVDTSGEAIADDVGAADIILTHYAAVPASAMDATGCSVVTCYATGVDNVDVEAATERGVAVTNVPKYCDEEVGEHIVTLALALRRGLPQYETHTEAGGWDWRAADAVHTASTQTLGFFAFGRKARVAASKADTFGFDVVAHDPYLSEEAVRDAGAEPVSFDELVEGSDILSLNAARRGRPRCTRNRAAGAGQSVASPPRYDRNAARCVVLAGRCRAGSPSWVGDCRRRLQGRGGRRGGEPSGARRRVSCPRGA